MAYCMNPFDNLRHLVLVNSNSLLSLAKCGHVRTEESIEAATEANGQCVTWCVTFHLIGQLAKQLTLLLCRTSTTLALGVLNE